jgi:antitoxin component YwqK of YwqJK toxin-antitoxin module
MYEGEWQGGKKNGKGKYFWSNGQVYEGEFKDNECHGAGVLYYLCGKKFEGQWKNGKKTGRCTYTWPNGSQYSVIYIDGKKQGEGLFEGNGISIDQIKSQYKSLQKKSVASRELMKNPPLFIY